MKSTKDNKLSKRSKRGLILLGTLTLALIYFPRFYFWMKPKEKFTIHSFPSKSWGIDNKERQPIVYARRGNTGKRKRGYFPPPKRFDPNEYNREDWMKLGLSSKQSEVILAFTGKKIYSNQDLEKIRVISADLFGLIKDSTCYPKRENTPPPVAKKEELKKCKLLELNNASEAQLQELKGIGPFFSKQIVQYRNSLGGFAHKEQLLEVWKMDVEKYEIIQDQIEVNPDLVTKIPLNRITAELLKEHPYVNWSIANSILKLRDQKNGYSKIEEIRESVLINDELFEKLKPYLTL
jgi:competence protein ComEA